MMQVTPRATPTRLGDICELKYGKNLPAAQREPGNVPVFGSNGRVGSHSQAFTSGPTIIVGRKGSIGEVAYSPEPCWPIDTTYFVDASATSADLRWLAWQLRALGLSQLNKAAAVPGLNRDDAYAKYILLPSLSEQRRIADILDRGDALRAKRREAIAKLEELPQAVLSQVLQQPSTIVRLEDVLAGDFRNGLSPATRGTVQGRVLTLSAITGGRFNAKHAKECFFERMPADEQLVTGDEFLICRGNGNLNLVGRGCLSERQTETIAFPDTMISMRPIRDRVLPEYLAAVWETVAVRRQIERLATTTNGTYKINQTKLRRVEIPLVDLAQQRRFVAVSNSINGVGRAAETHLAKLDELFSSLQHRAFRGEL